MNPHPKLQQPHSPNKKQEYTQQLHHKFQHRKSQGNTDENQEKQNPKRDADVVGHVGSSLNICKGLCEGVVALKRGIFSRRTRFGGWNELFELAEKFGR